MSYEPENLVLKILREIQATEIECKHGIIMELIKAHQRCKADSEFLSIIGSYGDTLDDSEVLELLRRWNETGKVLHEGQ
jgi:hypothetical protein